jgi:hypothetical protein
MATLSVIKFKGLTDRTGNSNYLIGSAPTSSNIFQSSKTPYEATYQINFNNDSSPVNFYPTQANLVGITPANDNAYAGRYKISRVIYSLNVNVSMTYDTGQFLTRLLECPANYLAFQTNMMLNNFLNFNRTIPLPQTSSGFEIPLVFTPQSGAYGFIQFTINYFDKYIVASAV